MTNQYRFLWKCTVLGVLAVISAAHMNGSRDLALAGSPTGESAIFLPAWSEGYFDIHHISTGRGDAAFFVFPDGTTMLFDAGERNPEGFEIHAPLKLAPERPVAGYGAGRYIAEYIKHFGPDGEQTRLDYAVISHFDPDHVGSVRKDSPKSAKGNYRLTGITAVGDEIPISVIIDRAAPHYDIPVEFTETTSIATESFENYRIFQQHYKDCCGLHVERLRAGVANQIRQQGENADRYEFSVRNIKVNGELWTGDGISVRTLFNPSVTVTGDSHQENPLSIALKISYGAFDYFTGGDNTGLQGFGLPAWFDVETPMAEVVGAVDVMTLNHHGNRDAVNASLLERMSPRVLVQQSWVSDHPGGEVLHRMISQAIWPGPRDIFATHILEETKVALGPWLERGYQSMDGHIVVRVEPGGEEYSVYILEAGMDNIFQVRSRHGPYRSR